MMYPSLEEHVADAVGDGENAEMQAGLVADAERYLSEESAKRRLISFYAGICSRLLGDIAADEPIIVERE